MSGPSEMSDVMVAPERAHTVVAKAGADTAEALAWELRRLADLIERGELTVGCSGAPSGGSIYSYRVVPMTHDEYFQSLHRWLSEREGGGAA